MTPDTLFTILSVRSLSAEDFEAEAAPQCGHPIYQAHFPGSPITPGVCLVQLILSLACRCMGRPLEVASVKNVKFLSTLVPTEETRVTCTLHFDQEGKRLQAVVKGAETIYAKMTLLLR